MFYTIPYLSPAGRITLAASDSALAGAWFDGQKYFGDGVPLSTAKRRSNPILCAAQLWLDAYFAGEIPSEFPLLAPVGTPFRCNVWKLLKEIPYGRTVTYGSLAAALNKPTSSRAVGGAVGRNPISVFIPCHRVIGAGNALTGYAAGIGTKLFLLRLESGRTPA